MFRITIMVQDKHLPDTLRKLVGIAVGPPEVEPVINTEVRGTQVRARTNGKGLDLLIDYMREHKMQEITGPDAKAACAKIGLNPSSYSHYMQDGIRQRRLKKIGAGKGNAVRYGLVMLREDKA